MATSTDTSVIFQRLQRVAAEARLPDVEVSTSYGTPALKVGGKAFVSVKNAETIVLALPIDHKEQLIEMAPEIYFQTDHYVGWPSLPLRIAAIRRRRTATPADPGLAVSGAEEIYRLPSTPVDQIRSAVRARCTAGRSSIRAWWALTFSKRVRSTPSPGNQLSSVKR